MKTPNKKLSDFQPGNLIKLTTESYTNGLYFSKEENKWINTNTFHQTKKNSYAIYIEKLKQDELCLWGVVLYHDILIQMIMMPDDKIVK